MDADDGAFRRPTKFIGPVYDAATAHRLAAERRWDVAADGRYWRRVVPSPAPRAVVELSTIRLLLAHDVVVVCVGGGGIPVVADADGRLRGVQAVVDKDKAAALLAQGLGADALLMLTDVSAVQLPWGTPAATPLSDVTADELARVEFPAGSMGPKVEAACSFVTATGGLAAIGALEDAAAIPRGERGTRVHAGAWPASVRLRNARVAKTPSPRCRPPGEGAPENYGRALRRD